MKSQPVNSIWYSSLTFRYCLTEKISFIALNMLDLVLTITASNLGLIELNPLMARILDTPWLLISFKIALPALISWLVPGKWLWPALALMCFVVGWDFKELLMVLHSWSA